MDQGIHIFLKEIPALAASFASMSGIDAAKDIVPKNQSVLNIKLSGQDASEPSHELQLWGDLVAHEVEIKGVVYCLQEVMVDTVALLHDHRLLFL